MKRGLHLILIVADRRWPRGQCRRLEQQLRAHGFATEFLDRAALFEAGERGSGDYGFRQMSLVWLGGDQQLLENWLASSPARHWQRLPSANVMTIAEPPLTVAAIRQIVAWLGGQSEAAHRQGGLFNTTRRVFSPRSPGYA